MPMSDEELELAETVNAALGRFEQNRERSQQRAIGISELGTCREKTRRTLLGLRDREKPFRMDAFVGSATGDRLEQALLEELWPDAIHQRKLTVDLGERWQLPGTPDIIRPDWGVLDGKTAAGYSTLEREGSTQQQRFQRQLYCLAASQMGLLLIDLDEAMTGNIYLDRGGSEDSAWVVLEPFSWDVIAEADEWLNDVAYAIENNEYASRDKPRNWCWAVCEHAPDCRGVDTDVAGLIEDPELVEAADVLYDRKKSLEKEAKALDKHIKATLKGIAGNTRHKSVRWIHVNGTTFTTNRKPYDRLEVVDLGDVDA